MIKNGTIIYRVTQLEKCQEETEFKLDQILENHLPHIKEELAGLRSEIKTLAILNIGAIILGLLLNKIL